MRGLLTSILLCLAGGCDRPAPSPSVQPTPREASSQTSSSATPTPATSPGDSTLSSAHLRLHPGFDPSLPCTCDADKLRQGWCWHCNVGYIAGHRVESARLFETLDPHGHQLDLQSLQLQMCTEAIAKDAWCDATGFGFVNKMAYFTKLTYGLARGRVVDASTIGCGVCRAGDRNPQWCPACNGGRGMVGNVAIADQQLFQATAAEYRNFLKAIDKAKTCEWCAAAMVVHRVCPICRISYENNTPEQTPVMSKPDQGSQ